MDAEVKALYTVGLDRCILASDAGGQTYGSPPSMFRAYLQLLLNTGLPLKDIRVLSSDRPKQLLHLS
jgi:hypothetical protein